MSLADILVHIDSSKSCHNRIDTAISLAKRFNARLTGIFVITRQYYQPGNGTAEKIAMERRELFCEKTGAAAIDAAWQSVDWSVIGVGMSEILSHYAHYSDLVIVGQSSGDASKCGVPADLPERMVLSTGRPVLIIPHSGTFPVVGNKIMVAWKAGRESTRAVNDALPFLKKAEGVTLFAVNSSESYGDDGESLCSNICSHLQRHGITATAEQAPALTPSVGDLLLNRAYEEGFDLLVMGGYARTPQGSVVLGGVARQLLKQMTVPVLMSH